MPERRKRRWLWKAAAVVAWKVWPVIEKRLARKARKFTEQALRRRRERPA